MWFTYFILTMSKIEAQIGYVTLLSYLWLIAVRMKHEDAPPSLASLFLNFQREK